MATFDMTQVGETGLALFALGLCAGMLTLGVLIVKGLRWLDDKITAWGEDK